jgi:hypothetical protein
MFRDKRVPRLPRGLGLLTCEPRELSVQDNESGLDIPGSDWRNVFAGHTTKTSPPDRDRSPSMPLSARAYLSNNF